jgi:hypothetical protein
MTHFDIFGQIGKEIQSFKEDKILIASTQKDTGRYLNKDQRGYYFNQSETLNLIDLYYNSKFETGLLDSEGQRKLFLNICAFRSDVASKMIDLDTKDFVFIPDDSDSKWGAWFIQKEFRDWARRNYFGEFINDLVENFPKYGTIVVKRVGKILERVPLKYLIVQQDAKDLNSSSHVIQIHDKMTKQEMKKYPNWDLSGVDLDFGQTETVYERYGEVPLSFYNKLKGISGEVDDDETIKCIVVTTCKQKENAKPGEYTGNVLFIEKINELPFEEVHWKKQEGRWLGIGEVENQFENQISRNMLANLRKRALQWSSKKIFQSPDDTIAKNLIRDVKDGDVLRIMPNGNITQVDMASRQLGEFQSAEQMWESNSDQKSFTYEVATGEALPSGTPFRMGVMLSNAVNSHFKLKKQKLGLFLKRLIVEQVFEIFKKENSKEHTLTIFGNESGITGLKKMIATNLFNKRIFDWAMTDGQDLPNFEVVKTLIEDEIKAKSHLFITIPDNFYDDVKHHIELTVTGEEIDINAKIQSLTTLYQGLAAKGDPRADQLLDKIMSYTGENLEAILGSLPTPQQVPPQQAPQMPQSNGMNQLANQNAPQEQQTM